MKPRTSAITDWRTRDEDLPDVLPDEEYERVITPQRHVVLVQLLVQDLRMAKLQIGPIDQIPFEICDESATLRTYRPNLGEIFETVRAHLADIGCFVVAPNAIRVVTGIDVRITVKNLGEVPKKPRVALIVEESKP